MINLMNELSDRLPGSMFDTFVQPWIVSFLLALLFGLAPLENSASTFILASLIILITSFSLFKIYAKIASREAARPRVNSVSSKLQAISKRPNVRVLLGVKEEAHTDWLGIIHMPSSKFSQSEFWAVLAHELAHFEGNHVPRRTKFLISSTVTLSFMSTLFPKVLEMNLVHQLTLMLTSMVISFVLWVATHWYLELLADFKAVQIAQRSSWVRKKDLIDRRTSRPEGVTFTHPPRRLRIWATQLAH